jgi:2-polyprenyl-6-methoxyphenol hydroxylase-like FAD-dependent oxidoreductase
MGRWSRPIESRVEAGVEHIDRTEVLVVGAGPTGLVAALTLVRAGVRVEVVDGKRGPTRESRALVVQARTMEVYDQLGVIASALAHATRADSIVPGYGRRSFRPVPLRRFGEGLTPYPHLHVLEQSRNEELLVEALADAGAVVHWGETLADLVISTDPLPVRATTTTEDGARHEIRARYCIGADGASSVVRSFVGIPFEGSTSEHRYYVADAVGVSGLVAGSANMRIAPDDFLLTFPMGADGRNRLLGVVPATGLDQPVDALEADVRRRLRTAFGVEYARLNWFSTYRVHHRAAARFRSGPVFLAGDAAHVHSPVGAQGMNTGVQDAHGLACKLVDVLRRGAVDDSLDRYEAERRPVAVRLVRTTDRMFTAVTSDRWLPRLMRDRVFPRVAPIATRIVQRAPGASRLFGYLSQVRIRYRMTDRPGHRESDPVVGRRLPWNGRNYAVLRSLAWQVHAYSRRCASDAATIGDQLGCEAHVFDGPGPNGLRQDRLYLVRPDGFVAAAARPGEALGRFRSVVDGQLGRLR